MSIPVSRVAKWKTTLQLVALGFLIAGPAGDKVLPNNTTIGLVLLWIAALLTIYTGGDYLRSGISHILEDESRAMKAVYFAWVRERIGKTEEPFSRRRRRSRRSPISSSG